MQYLHDVDFINLTPWDKHNCEFYCARIYRTDCSYEENDTNQLVKNFKGDNTHVFYRNQAIKQFADELKSFYRDDAPIVLIPMPSANPQDNRLLEVIRHCEPYAKCFDVLRYRTPRISQYKGGDCPTREALEESMYVEITEEAFKVAIQWSNILEFAILDDGIKSGLQFSVARQKLAEYGVEVKTGLFWYRVV